MHVENILLSNGLEDFEAEQPQLARNTVAELAQDNRMRRSRIDLALFDDNSLQVKTSGLRRQPKDFRINVRILDSRPRRSLIVCWHGFLLALGLAAGGCYLLFGNGGQTSTPMVAMLLSAALLSLVVACYRSHDRLVYYSRHGRAPLLVLFNNLPDKDACRAFTSRLSQAIEEARLSHWGRGEILNDELKAHRSLMEAGVISERRYAIVKQRILDLHR